MKNKKKIMINNEEVIAKFCSLVCILGMAGMICFKCGVLTPYLAGISAANLVPIG